MAEKKSKLICHICEAGCGVIAAHEGRQVTAVRGNQDDLFSHGYMCPKGVSLKELDEDPDRIRTPLIRRNGRFEETNWPEAWALIEERLGAIQQAHGTDAVALYIGNPTAHAFELAAGVGVLRKALRTRNVYSAGSVDQFPKQVACGLMYGEWLSIPVPDIDRADYLLILGANPIVSNGSLWMVPDYRGRARKLQERGGRIVVVDPRFTETAKAADQHLAIRPGTDAFFLLGILNELFAQGARPAAHLVPHLNGWEAIQTIAQRFPPERVASKCGIAPETIREIADELLTRERAAVYGRCGTSMQQFGTAASWLIELVNIVAGNLDRPGGSMFATPAAFGANTKGAPGQGRGAALGKYRSRVRGMPEVLSEFPLATLADEIETSGKGQVRALVCCAGNPAVSGPNAARIARAFAKLDFMVAVDIYLNETTRHADVILPSPSHFERPHYDLFLGAVVSRNVARYAPAVFDLPKDQPTDWRLMLQLSAIASGAGTLDDDGLDAMEDHIVAGAVDAAAEPDGPLANIDKEKIKSTLAERDGIEQLLDLELRTGPFGDGFGARPEGLTLEKLLQHPDGIDYGPLVPRVPELLRTETGTIEMAPPLLLAEVDVLERALDAPDSRFLLIGRRQVRSNNSWLHNLPVLAKGPFRCTLQINPGDAAELGIEDASPVRVVSAAGEVTAQAELTGEMMPGVVSLPHGWGHDAPELNLSVAALRPGVNSNLLAEDGRLDGPSGTAVLNGIPVEIAPAAAQAAAE